MNLDSLSHLRQSILLFLKREGPATMVRLALQMKVTKEAVRQQLVSLHREGFVQKDVVRVAKARSGRPMVRYSLTSEGDHLFPKDYDSLAVEILETVGQKLGPEALRELLSGLTEARVQKWKARLEGKTLAEKVNSLKDLYQAKDPFSSVSRTSDGYRLVEGNCPFLNIASEQPALCSVSVSALTQLLGVKVVREERFQSGHGHCVFHIFKNQQAGPKDLKFQLEPELPKTVPA